MLEEQNFEQTGERQTLKLRGNNKVFNVVLIPLELLKYNKLNGRIATYVSEYESQNKKFPTDLENFNNKIEDFIFDSKPESLIKTKNNIKKYGQYNAAVVLNDGTIVDGNRRFTALRKLARDAEGQQFSYLKAVILDGNTYTKKELKTLELNLQHALEERLDYNPIDRLVDIYRDLISEDREFTIEEYAREVDANVNDIKKEVEISKLMIEYLQFLKQDNKFYIARDQKVDGPLREIYKTINNKKVDPDEVDDIKEMMFAAMLTMNGDSTKRVRAVGDLLKDGQNVSEMYSEIEDDLDDLDNYLNDEIVKDEVKKDNVINVPESIRETIAEKFENKVELDKTRKAQSSPVNFAKKAYENIAKVDLDMVNLMSYENKEELNKTLESIVTKITEIRNF